MYNFSFLYNLNVGETTAVEIDALCSEIHSSVSADEPTTCITETFFHVTYMHQILPLWYKYNRVRHCSIVRSKQEHACSVRLWFRAGPSVNLRSWASPLLSSQRTCTEPCISKHGGLQCKLMPICSLR